MVLTVLAALTFIVTALSAIVAGVGTRKLRHLVDIVPIPASGAPSVSIVVAARNEDAAIEPAVRSLLAQDLPRLEVIVVDDRSTDGTAAILDRLAGEDVRLRVVHVAELPAGWLGKNHALQRGAERATGEWILFTDADVVFRRDALRRGLAHALAHGYDHVAAGPGVDVPGVMGRAFLAAFALYFGFFTRPWKARDPRSRYAVGIGAFNLVRAAAWRAIGGHASFGLRPDDDLRLGRALKGAGFRQDLVFGRGLLEVTWYPGVRAMVDGLMKNAFAAVDYRVSLTLAGTAAILVLHVWPFAALAVTSGWARALNAGTAATLLASCAVAARYTGVPAWIGLLFPLAALLQAYVLIRSMVVVLRDGGITWRGTRYPLSELRRPGGPAC